MLSTISQVLQIIAPVFILAAIGFLWVKAGWEYNVKFVTRVTMTLAVPCLIFTSLVRSEIEVTALRNTALAALVAYVLVTVVSSVILRGLKYDQRTFLPPMVFGNTGNLGLPLAFFSFGAVGFDFAVVIFAIMAFLSFTIGIWFVSGGKSVAVAIKEPMVWSTVFGALFVIFDWDLPDWSMNALDLVGQMGIPLMLITLGVAITRLHPASLNRAVWLSLMKLVICVAIPVGVGIIIDLPPLAFAALILQVATPVAVTSYMLAEKYGADSGEVAGLVVVSTLFSILAIPLILVFLI
ncbi:MAG: AEC family transporter [Rhodobacteraceae bacterium]|nr:AEC family transporter [Paracoccaceae bacterium]